MAFSICKQLVNNLTAHVQTDAIYYGYHYRSYTCISALWFHIHLRLGVYCVYITPVGNFDVPVSYGIYISDMGP